MNKNRIIMAALAMSLLYTQPIVAADQPKSNIVNRAKKEYQEFWDALKCVRQQGFRKCTRTQKKRVIIAGVALAAIVIGATYGGIHWWKKKQILAKMQNLTKENELLYLFGGGKSIHFAASEGDIEMLKVLLERGDNVTVQDTGGNTALHYAVNRPYSYDPFAYDEVSGSFRGDRSRMDKNVIQVAELLLGKGADVNAKNWVGKTPLGLAVQRERLEVADFLLKKGASLEIRIGSAGRTLLHWLSERGTKRSMEWMVKKGANLNAKDFDGRIALHDAIYYGNERKAEFLVKKGADLFIKDNDGQTPLDLVKDSSFKQKLLEEWRRRHGTIGLSIKKTAQPETELADPTQPRVPELAAEMIWKIIEYTYPSDQ